MEKTDSLVTSAKCSVGVEEINNSTIIAIGECANGVTIDRAKSSSLVTVELGQAELNWAL